MKFKICIKHIIIAIVLGLLFVTVFAQSALAQVIRLNASQETGYVGDTVTVKVNISNALQVEGGQFDLSFGPTVAGETLKLEPISISGGDFVTSFTNASYNLNVGGNKLRVLWVTSAGSTKASGVVCTIVFRITEAGETPLNFSDVVIVIPPFGSVVGGPHTSGKVTGLTTPPTTTHSVRFDLNGAPGAPPAAQKIAHNSYLARPPSPSRPGYLFSGWFANRVGIGLDWFNYLNNYWGNRIKGNITLYAKWVESGFTEDDHYFFTNNNANFSPKYRINDDYYQILLDSIPNDENIKNILNNFRNRSFSGACHGMGVTIVLFKDDKPGRRLKPSFFQHKFEDNRIIVKNLKVPKDEPGVKSNNFYTESLINFYQIAQLLPVNINQYSGLEAMVNAVRTNKWTLISINLLEENLDGNRVAVGGHLVIGHTVIDQGDSHKILLVESNAKKNDSYIIVTKDYSNASFYCSWGWNGISTEAGTLSFGKVRDISIYDSINLQEQLIKRGKATGYLMLSAQSSVETVFLTTNYHHFIITDQLGNTAEVNGTEVSGNLSITFSHSDVEPGFDLIRNNYSLDNVTGYTIEPLDDLELYETEMFYDTAFGCYSTARTAGPDEVSFTADGVVSAASDQEGHKNISTTINSAVTPWYTVSVGATLQDLTLTPAPDNNVISSAGPLGAIDVVVYNDHNEIPLSLNTSETAVIVKNTSGGGGGSNVAIVNLTDEILAETPLTYAVVFRTYGGSPVDGLSGLPHNALVAKPEDPTFPGFIFAGWYKDAECTDGQEWYFNTDRITKDTFIHAKWDEDEGFLHEVLFKAEGFDCMVIIVYDGDSIDTIPDVPEKVGYRGVWDTNNFKDIKTDMVVNAIYTPIADSIQIFIEPAAARTAGAQWRLTTGPDTGWKNHGAAITGLAPGAYTITFKELSGWSKPADITVELGAGGNVFRTGNYTEKGGTPTPPTPPPPTPDPTPKTDPVPKTKLGDITGNGKIDAEDAILVMQHVLNLKVLTNDQKKAADVNGDGKLDIRDVVLIMRKALGLIDKFPIE